MGKILLGYVRGPQGETGPEGDLQTAEGTVSISNIYKIIESDDVDGTALEIHTGAEPNRVYVQGIKSTDYLHTIIGTKFENGDGWQQKIQVTNEITSEPPEFVWRYLVANVPSEWFEFKGASVLSEDTTAVASDVRVGKTYLGNDTYDEVGTGTLGADLTAVSTDILSGKTAVGKNGEDITGSIPSVPGSTITPTKQEQTAVSARNYVAGDVKVAAIPANYVDRGTSAKTAAAGDVRKGKTFIGANDAQLSGTLVEQAAKTVGATTSDQTIVAANTIVNGAQIVKAVTNTNLAAANIKNGVTITVASNNANIYSVAGNYGSTTTLTDASNLVSGQVAIGNKGATVYTGTLATQGGQTFRPTAAGATLVTAPKKVTANIIVSGDSNLVAGNIKKGVSIFGIAGSYEDISIIYNNGKYGAGWAYSTYDISNYIDKYCSSWGDGYISWNMSDSGGNITASNPFVRNTSTFTKATYTDKGFTKIVMDGTWRCSGTYAYMYFGTVRKLGSGSITKQQAYNTKSSGTSSTDRAFTGWLVVNLSSLSASYPAKTSTSTGLSFGIYGQIQSSTYDIYAYLDCTKIYFA